MGYIVCLYNTLYNVKSIAVKKIKSTLDHELSNLEWSLSNRYSSLDTNHNSESLQKLIKTNLSMKNQIENLKAKNFDLIKQNSELKREIQFISKCKNCSKSTTTERQLFRQVFIL